MAAKNPKKSADQAIVAILAKKFGNLDGRIGYDGENNLISLNLGDFKLTQLPFELGQLTSLQRLYLGKNQLGELPGEIGKLTSLQELSLNNNQLIQLPGEIGELTSLQKLYLHRNQLRELPGEIGELTSLHLLYLNNNQLRELPGEIGELTSLERLFVSVNQLTQIPGEVGKLTSLERLSFDNNQLTQLPVELGKLTNLVLLSVGGNANLLTPPPEIVASGTQAMVGFLQDLQESSVVRFEAKLLMVGEGGTGKSSLLRALRNEAFEANLATTHGIEVNRLMLPHPQLAHTKLTLNSWDFGGQHIYHATHQFFLTKRSLYLVVWNARLGVEQGRLHFWLDTIKALAPEAPVLLVATHVDERVPDLNYQLYKDAYPQLVGSFNVSNKDGLRIDDLHSALAQQAVKIGLMGQPWPTKWVEAEKSLQARKEHHISADRYARICGVRRINGKIAQGTLGSYLHDLGKILYFRDDYLLCDLIVLKPNWVTKAISHVLEDTATWEAKGILAHADLPRIWASDEDGKAYEPHLYPIFLRLMERFDLSYQIDPELPNSPSTRSLIPQLLPHEPPENLPAWPQTPVAEQIHVEMRYHFDFLPAGIMPWFIVRTHRYTRAMHWREGVILQYQRHTARVELNPIRRELRLAVWGVQPHNFFTILMNTVDLILERFEGLAVQRLVPCICVWQSGQTDMKCVHFYHYEKLVRRIDDQRYSVECPESYRDVSVTELLYGIHSSTNQQVIATIAHDTLQLLQGQQQILTISTEALRSLQGLSQLSELIWRALIRQWNYEMQKMEAECPSIFFLTLGRGESVSGQGLIGRAVDYSKRTFNPQNWLSQEYGLYLVCQHPEDPHQVGEGYSLREAKDWWIKISPWLNHLVAFLNVAVPLSKALGDIYFPLNADHLKNQVALLEEITKNVPALGTLDTLESATTEPHLHRDQQAIGPALRVLHSFLDKADPAHHWGGLCKIVTPDGNILWLCETHRQQYEARPLDPRYLK